MMASGDIKRRMGMVLGGGGGGLETGLPLGDDDCDEAGGGYYNADGADSPRGFQMKARSR